MKTDEAFLRELRDREAIRDSILRYCRGVDRLDGELLRSAYHADGLDDHGIFVGYRDAWVDWVLDFHSRMQHRTQHMVLNHVCEIAGDEAHSETYWLFAGVNREGPPLTLTGGRYVDRFERRDGIWAIAARKCVVEWREGDTTFMPVDTSALYQRVGTSARDRSDMSYDRPLRIDAARVGFSFEGETGKSGAATS